MSKDWTSIAGFLARYLGIKTHFSDPQIAAMSMANWIIAMEPELAPYVLQVIAEG